MIEEDNNNTNTLDRTLSLHRREGVARAVIWTDEPNPFWRRQAPTGLTRALLHGLLTSITLWYLILASLYTLSAR